MTTGTSAAPKAPKTPKAAAAPKAPAAPKPAAAPKASATTQAQSQMSLLPAYAQLGESATVALAELPPNSDLIGPAPTDAFASNIKEFGVIQPILLQRRTNGTYIVAGGRRRVKAARLAGLRDIPALVYPVGWVSIEVLTTIENEQRSDNAAADLAAMESLIAQGANEAVISEATGKSVAGIRTLLRLKGFIPELRTAFNEGKFKDSVAFKIIGLKPDDQRRLISTLAKDGRLINKDVDLIIASTIQPKPAVPAAVPAAAAPAASAAVDDDEEDTRPWYEQVIDLVKQIQALAPIDATDVVEIADDLLKFAEYAAATAVATP